MAAKFPEIGTEATLVLAAAPGNWTAKVTAINLNGASRPAIKTSNLATTAWDTFMPGDLADPGDVQVDVILDPDDDVFAPLALAVGTVTLVFPPSVPTNTGATYVNSNAFVTDISAVVPLEDLITASYTIKFGGPFTHTPES